jgi:hypothetical protein
MTLVLRRARNGFMMHWMAHGNSGRFDLWSAVRVSPGLNEWVLDFSKFQRLEMDRRRTCT